MRILNLQIKTYKNLIGFCIDFEEEQRPVLLIGQNGSGKSNFYEALTKIFISIDSNTCAEFDFNIEYICNGYRIYFSQNNRKRTAKIDGEKVSIRKITDYEDNTFRKKYIPKRVVAYYSGQSDRLHNLFRQSEDKFKRMSLKDNNYPLSYYEGEKKNISNQSLRRFIYTENIYSNFILLSFLTFNENNQSELINKYTKIEKIEFVEITLKKPLKWSSKKTVDSVFWNASGVVLDYLTDIERLAMLVEDTGKVKRYLFKNIDDFRKFADEYGDIQELFKIIEIIYLSDLLESVKVKVKMKDGSTIFCDDLSEGERQLLTVFGMIRFVGDDESLFILDEPETHLNPTWRYKYMELLMEQVGDKYASHIFVTTHEPLMITGLENTQVKIFSKGINGDINIENPDISLKGIGVEGMLTSPLFGLRSTLDTYTLNKLDRKRELFIKLSLNTITSEEKIELQYLSNELGGMEFGKTTLDDMYSKFLRALNKNGKKESILNYDEAKKNDEIALRVVQDIIRGKIK